MLQGEWTFDESNPGGSPGVQPCKEVNPTIAAPPASKPSASALLLSTLVLGAAVWLWWTTGLAERQTALEVRTVPQGAEITLDGKAVGRSDLTLKDLVPGRVEVVARLTGHREVRREVRIEKGKTGLVALTLSPLPGTLVLKVQGPEEFLLASAEETWETPRELHLEPGEHRFLVRAPGFREKSVRTRVQAGGRTTLAIALEKAPLPSLPPAPPLTPPAPRMPPEPSLPANPSWPRVPAELPQVRLPINPTRPAVPPRPTPRAPAPRAVLTPVPPPSTPPAAVLTPVPPPRTVPGTVPQPLLTPVNR
jgi:hypothetical protein